MLRTYRRRLSLALKAEFAEPWELREILGIYKDYEPEKLNEEQIVLHHEHIKRAVILMIGMKGVILMKLEGVIVGAICGYYIPCQFTADVFFHTMILYIKEEARRFTGRFIKLVREILKQTVATKFVVGCMAFKSGERLERFWSMLGFKTMEKHLYMEIV